MIEQERWYSITELLELSKKGVVPYKSRTTWLELINKGSLQAIQKGTEKRKAYMLQGKDITAYLDATKIQQGR